MGRQCLTAFKETMACKNASQYSICKIPEDFYLKSWDVSHISQVKLVRVNQDLKGFVRR